MPAGARVMLGLAAVNGVVYMVLHLVMLRHPGALSAMALPPLLWQWMEAPWTALTYMFTHLNFFHLFFNVLTLVWFGTLLSEKVKALSLLRIYVGGGLAGAMVFLLTVSMNPAPLLGASASVMAVMTVAAFTIGNYTLHLFFLGDVRLKWFVLVMLLLAFVNSGGGSFAAHSGGVIFGCLWCLWRRCLLWYRNVRATAAPAVRRPTRAGARRVASVLEQNRNDRIRLDELLDKIKVSGYDSLSRSEKAELDEISRRIGN